MIEGYYDRFDPAKGYDRHLFRAGKGLQSAELNEIQQASIHRIRSIGDAIFSDGDIVEGCECVVDVDAGTATLGAGQLYLRGMVREIDSAQLTIPVDTTVRIGVWLAESVITELEDPTLRDPATGTRNYQEPGAARLKTTIEWGLETDDADGDFYPVHTIVDGALVQHAPSPQMDAVTVGLARYDREANGSYIVDGLRTTFIEQLDGRMVFSLSEGKAHVDGFEVGLPAARRLIYEADFDTQMIESEPHRFVPDANGQMVITISHAPLAKVHKVDITAEKTAQLTHGGYAGAKDPLPDTAVLEIVGITQGTTTYEQGEDYKLTGNTVDWSLSGSEPAPGSSYEVVYRYRTAVEPDALDDRTVTVSGAVTNTLVLIDYEWKLPRIDRLTLDKDGIVRRIKGLSSRYNPAPPSVPAGQMAMARIEYDWMSDPVVVNDGVHVTPMEELEDMQAMIYDLYDMMARERLKNDAAASEPAAARGIFVDPFLDDDMRDQGVTQTAAIVDGELVLPVDAQVVDLFRTASVAVPSYELEAVIEQTARTGSMKINPYQAFEPLPARCKLILDTDHWTETRTTWLSDITRLVVRGGGALQRLVRIDVGTRPINRQIQQSQFLRPATVRFEVEGFSPGERLAELTFDGIAITPEATV